MTDQKKLTHAQYLALTVVDSAITNGSTGAQISRKTSLLHHTVASGAANALVKAGLLTEFGEPGGIRYVRRLAAPATPVEAPASAAPVEQLPDRELDHDDECVGCGAHMSGPCRPTCPFLTGDVDAAVILRSAANRLHRHRRLGGPGFDVHHAVIEAAIALTGAWTPRTAWTVATDALTVYLRQSEADHSADGILIPLLGGYATDAEIHAALSAAAEQ